MLKIWGIISIIAMYEFIIEVFESGHILKAPKELKHKPNKNDA